MNSFKLRRVIYSLVAPDTGVCRGDLRPPFFIRQHFRRSKSAATTGDRAARAEPEAALRALRQQGHALRIWELVFRDSGKPRGAPALSPELDASHWPLGTALRPSSIFEYRFSSFDSAAQVSRRGN